MTSLFHMSKNSEISTDVIDNDVIIILFNYNIYNLFLLSLFTIITIFVMMLKQSYLSYYTSSYAFSCASLSHSLDFVQTQTSSYAFSCI